MPRTKTVTETLKRKSLRILGGEEKTHNDNEGKRKRSCPSEDAEPRKFLKKSKDGREIDFHCWNCHKPGQDQICVACPRVYHNYCLKSSANFSPQGACPECQLESIDGTRFPASLHCKKLKNLLQYVMIKIFPSSAEFFAKTVINKRRQSKQSEKIILKPEFIKWPQHKFKMCRPMDMEILIDSINADVGYAKTAEFYSDVKWIYHNCYKAYGGTSQITKASNKLLKDIRDELLDIEACHECYNKLHNPDYISDCDPFVLLCDNIHTLLWVKLKGYSAWPSKCLKVIDDVAHIRFFGTHEKASVKVNTCYLMSRENPSGKRLERASYQYAIDEMNIYVKNYERKYGPFGYAEEKTIFGGQNSSLGKKLDARNKKRKWGKEPAVTEKQLDLNQTRKSFEFLNEDPEVYLDDDTSSHPILIQSVSDDASGIQICSTGIVDAAAFQNEEIRNGRLQFPQEHKKNLISNHQSNSETKCNYVPVPLSVSMMFSDDSNLVTESNNSSVTYSNELETALINQSRHHNSADRSELAPMSMTAYRTQSIASSSNYLMNPPFNNRSSPQPCVSEYSYSDGTVEADNINVPGDRSVFTNLDAASKSSSVRQDSACSSSDILRSASCSDQDSVIMQSISLPLRQNERPINPQTNEERECVEFLCSKVPSIVTSSYPKNKLDDVIAEIADPKLKAVMAKSNKFVKNFAPYLIHQWGEMVEGPRLILNLLEECVNILNEKEHLQNENKELKAKLKKVDFSNNTGYILNGLKRKAQAEKQKEFEGKISKLTAEIEMLQNMLEAKRNSPDAKSKKMENTCSIETETDLIMEDIMTRDEVEVKILAVKLQCEQIKNEEVLNAKKNDWNEERSSSVLQRCAQCLKPANIHCCWNTNYCDQECLEIHRIKHQSSCQNVRKMRPSLTTNYCHPLAFTTPGSISNVQIQTFSYKASCTMVCPEAEESSSSSQATTPSPSGEEY